MDEKVRRNVLGRIPYGVYVVGVRRGTGEISAFTATWLSQCSFQPPRIMLGVKAGSTGHEMIESDRVLAVSLLASGQKDLAGAFFKRPEVGPGTLNGIPYRPGTNGCPILGGAPAFLECRVVEMLGGGDHTVVVAEVVEAGASREAPPLTLAETGWKYGG
jgi:flavin reductase (DIM6/NTAB) family NADH-FMN oxidoreductase RutF